MIFLEFFCYLFAVFNLKNSINSLGKKPQGLYNYRVKLYNYDVYFDKLIKYSFKSFGDFYSKKKPIVVMGCSYAFGQGLKDKQTFSYKLSKKAKRPVFNWSIGGGVFSTQLLFIKILISQME